MIFFLSQLIISLLKYSFFFLTSLIVIALTSLIVVALIFLVVGMLLLYKDNRKKAIIQQQYDSATETCMVRLVRVGDEHIQIIKTLKQYTTWDLSTAKEKIELPLSAILISHMPLDLAHKLKDDLAQLDTTIELIKH